MGGAKRWDLHTPASDADRAMDDKQDVAIDVLAAMQHAGDVGTSSSEASYDLRCLPYLRRSRSFWNPKP